MKPERCPICHTYLSIDNGFLYCPTCDYEYENITKERYKDEI